ncbi:MAG: hypothetical protein A3G33_09455 [Omnitrophica bacterium RIFCSPLOWO2_12_FULL_44_17]|uniref:diphosphoinositol-polyphosphate diphosphatase n=1 Tax=Candidatus Danuiimicrobium aquiferis TaxID=1801832 RepID=A0A1G1KWZ2_9BACT|nr:MAG: hypothetical protein A3B72_09905 [Omnitrophica bacterium RIFCSPHIGHO2_02_FULL_45_28]OGW91047.1 MAG: hypothetical protein A3E74_00350 [Omnitrophica bacterium RIFCSPHIGHO2_12_FULL_44_12]OGW97407.1 MAG: hypothetical protein A3G33_09455 [Omnitrophica bacterium RIFCSPLOWO2_12_FULL_44_17]OGX04481.1 MAG: hypothetical protein A3J12_10495 [Omnitrophica bacterium RIFCSPLOWO2_02_FULL_44_11]
MDEKQIGVRLIDWKIPVFTVLILMTGSCLFAFSRAQKAIEEVKKAVPRFAEVVPGIYRCGLLQEDVAPYLKEMGVKTVLSFHDDRTIAKDEESFLKDSGINMVWLPLQGFDRPSDDLTEKALKLMSTSELQPVLVHCKRGAERTGLIVGLYRIKYQKWTAEQARQEMKTFGFREFWYGHLKQYLYDYAKKQASQNVQPIGFWEELKINTLYYLYKVKKLNPFD